MFFYERKEEEEDEEHHLDAHVKSIKETTTNLAYYAHTVGKKQLYNFIMCYFCYRFSTQRRNNTNTH